MPHHEDSTVAIAQQALEPLLCSLESALVEQGVAFDVVHELFGVVAEIYAAGHLDGVRHAVAEIAPEAERHGLRLWLSSELLTHPGSDPRPHLAC